MHATPDEWQPYAEGTTVGKPGSEEGTVVIDQQYRSEARITLERDCRIGPYAITCGVYGAMHTHFESTLEDAVRVYGEMKDDIERMVEVGPQQWGESEEAYHERISEAIHAFVERYW